MQLSLIFLSDHEFASKMNPRAFWHYQLTVCVNILHYPTISFNNFNQTTLIGHPSSNSNVTKELFKCSIDY